MEVEDHHASHLSRQYTYDIGLWDLPPGRELPLHTHRFFECFVVTGGRPLQTFPTERKVMGRGEVFFVHPECVHGFANPADAEEGARWINLRFDSRCHEQLRSTIGAEFTTWPWIVGASTGFHLSYEICDAFESLVANLPHQQRRLMDLMALLCPLLAQVQDQDPVGKRPPRWFEKAIEALRQHEVAAWHLETFIAHCHRSRDYVARVFQEHHGTTTTRWLRNQRLEEAAQILKFGDAPIIDVALECGFPSLSVFYRYFRDHFGCSPAAFRKRWRNPSTATLA